MLSKEERDLEQSVYEKRLKSLGIELPKLPAPLGSYVPWVMSGNLLYLSGSVSSLFQNTDGTRPYVGAVGRERTLEEGQAAARYAAMVQMAAIRDALGSIDWVKRIVFMTGFVWGVEGFPDSPKVINGASDLFGAVFGESGRHARAAVAVAGLPEAQRSRFKPWSSLTCDSFGGLNPITLCLVVLLKFDMCLLVNIR